MIGLTIEVNEEIAYNFGVFGKAKTNRGSSIFFVELQNVQLQEVVTRAVKRRFVRLTCPKMFGKIHKKSKT